MILQLPVQRVHVVKPRIGGGFGGKQEMLLEDICGALALATRRPVKIEYTREEEFYMARSRHPQILNIKMGVKRDGTLMANKMTVYATTARTAATPTPFREILAARFSPYTAPPTCGLSARCLHQYPGGGCIPWLWLPAGLLCPGIGDGRNCLHAGDGSC